MGLEALDQGFQRRFTQVEALQGLAIGFSMRDASIVARAVRHLVGDDQIDLRLLERDLAQLLGEVDGGGFSPAPVQGMLPE